MKVIIVGGVAGGASCAARLRRLDESAQIIVFEKSASSPTPTAACPITWAGRSRKDRR